MKVSLTMISGNRKTGPMPTSGSTSDTCPPSCPFLKNGCYASVGLTRIHWKRLDNNLVGMTWDAFCKTVKSITRGALWRHNVFGDLPPVAPGSERINDAMLAQLVTANRGRKGFTYTHRHVDPANYPAIKHANENGFTVNLSANNLAHADTLADLNIGPVCAIVPSTVDGNQIRTMSTPAGRKGVVCPATYREASTCANCGLCQRADRSVIVLFPAHGTSFKRVDAIAARVHDHSTPTLAASAAA